MAKQRAATYREVFASGEFRALFGAELLSVIGDQFARVALTVLVWQRTESATLTALTYALTVLPIVVGGPLLSGLADRYPRRQVMVVTDLARAGLLVVMAVPGVSLAVLCVLLVAVQLLAAPFSGARAATLVAVFYDNRDRYEVANLVANITHQAGQLVGFAAGGLLVAGLHPSAALVGDAATFVVSALIIRVGILTRPAPADAPSRAGWVYGMAAGAGLVRGNRVLRALLLLMCLPAFSAVIEGLAVPYADAAKINLAAVGLLFAADPAGSIIGGLLIKLRPMAQRVRLMPILAVLSSLVLVACAFQPGLWLTVVVWGLSGVFSAYFFVANGRLNWAAPDSQRGQVTGLVFAAVKASQAMLALAAGVAADLVAPSVVIAIAGAIGAVAAWLAGASWLKASRQAPTTAGPPVDRR